jgi:hypothetical protein
MPRRNAMIKINGDALSDSVNKCLKEMKRATFIESDSIAIAQVGDMQVHVTITRDEDAFMDEIQDGLAEAL